MSFVLKQGDDSQPGIQFNGVAVPAEVMKFSPGSYHYPDKGALLFFLNEHFLLKLPDATNQINATDAPDYIYLTGLIGTVASNSFRKRLLITIWT